MRRLAFPVMVLVAGLSCAKVEEFRLEDPPHCAQPFYSWDGGLTLSLLRGGGSGQFDYDPAGRVETRLYGQYELGSGKLAYAVEFDPEAWQAEQRVVGTEDGRGGYARENGDLDLWYTITLEDIAGREFVTEVREKREGCVVDLQTIGNGVLTRTLGTYAGNEFRYTRTVDDIEVEGTRRPDLTWTESYGTDADGVNFHSETNGDGDGYSLEDWSQTDAVDETDWVGQTERFIDGSQHVVYTYRSSDREFDWDATIDYGGDGDGTYSDDQGSCDISYQDFDCAIDCDGTLYDC